MLLHVAHAARNGHHKIMIQTVDTDVVVLAVEWLRRYRQKMSFGWLSELERISQLQCTALCFCEGECEESSLL